MSSSRLLFVPVALLGLGLAAGCGGKADEASNASGRTASEPTSNTSPRATTPAPPADLTPRPPVASPTPQAPSRNRYAARCGSTGGVRAALERLGARTGSVRDADGSRLPVTVAGAGDTALVVLHGAGGDACDAQEFLATAAMDKRFRVFAVDLCSSRASACVGEFSLDDAAQSGLILETVREQYDPRKVVLVGVGTGGAMAVRAAGVGVPADALVNVSGKASAADLRRVTVPMLHLYDEPGSAAASGARTAAGESRRVTVSDAPANGWAALTDGDRLTGSGRDALSFAAR